MGKNSLLVLVLLLTPEAFATACPEWQPAQEVGRHDRRYVNEASGIEVTEQGRIYSINDSGDGPYFYYYNRDHARPKKVRIRRFRPTDTEDLSLGWCGKQRCLAIADIGDNDFARKDLKIVFIAEQKHFPKEGIHPLDIVSIRYPSGPQDAEAVAFYPNGDLWIVTKGYHWKEKKHHPIRLFRLPKGSWQSRKVRKSPIELLEVASFDLREVAPRHDRMGQMITGADFSHDGKTLLMLTYRSVIQLKLQFQPYPVLRSLSFDVSDVKVLEQQESIAYLPRGMGFLYDSEIRTDLAFAPIMRVQCRDSITRNKIAKDQIQIRPN